MLGLIVWNFKLTHSRETHPCNTRHKDNVQMPKYRCQWRQQRLTYQAIIARMERSFNVYENFK